MNLWDVMTADLSKEEFRVIRSVGWRVIVAVFICFAMGWFTPVGINGFARADDMQRKAETLTSALLTLTQTVNRVGAAQQQQTLALLRTAIVDAQVKKCQSHKPETTAIYRQVVMDAQERYYAIAQQSFSAPSCADL